MTSSQKVIQPKKSWRSCDRPLDYWIKFKFNKMVLKWSWYFEEDSRFGKGLLSKIWWWQRQNQNSWYRMRFNLGYSDILHIAHESSSKTQQALCLVYNCSLLRSSWSYLPRFNEGQNPAAANLERKTWLGRMFTFGASFCLAKFVCWYLPHPGVAVSSCHTGTQ